MTMARNRYILNNGEFGNLSTTFTRNIATVDDFAQAVSANVPRYGRAQAISDYDSWHTALTTNLVMAINANLPSNGMTRATKFVLGDAALERKPTSRLRR